MEKEPFKVTLLQIDRFPEPEYIWMGDQNDRPETIDSVDWEDYVIHNNQAIVLTDNNVLTEAYEWFGEWFHIVNEEGNFYPVKINPTHFVFVQKGIDKEKIRYTIHKVKELKVIADKLISLGFLIESELINSIHEFIDILIKDVDGQDEWISWFIYENDFGESELEAGEDGNMIKVKSIEDLFRVIEM